MFNYFKLFSLLVCLLGPIEAEAADFQFRCFDIEDSVTKYARGIYNRGMFGVYDFIGNDDTYKSIIWQASVAKVLRDDFCSWYHYTFGCTTSNVWLLNSFKMFCKIGFLAQCERDSNYKAKARVGDCFSECASELFGQEIKAGSNLTSLINQISLDDLSNIESSKVLSLALLKCGIDDNFFESDFYNKMTIDQQNDLKWYTNNWDLVCVVNFYKNVLFGYCDESSSYYYCCDECRYTLKDIVRVINLIDEMSSSVKNEPCEDKEARKMNYIFDNFISLLVNDKERNSFENDDNLGKYSTYVFLHENSSAFAKINDFTHSVSVHNNNGLYLYLDPLEPFKNQSKFIDLICSIIGVNIDTLKDMMNRYLDYEKPEDLYPNDEIRNSQRLRHKGVWIQNDSKMVF